MGIFDAIANVGQKTSGWLVGAGKKAGHWATHLGSKSTYQDIAKQLGSGLDYTIQGAKYLTKKIDETPYLGEAMRWVPFEQAVFKGVDLADHLRKVAKGESKFSWGKLAEDVILGGLSAVGGSAELQGFKKAGQFLSKGKFLTGSMKHAIPARQAFGGAGRSILEGQLGKDLGGWVAGKTGKGIRGLEKASEWGSTGRRLRNIAPVASQDAGAGVAKDVGRKTAGQIASLLLTASESLAN